MGHKKLIIEEFEGSFLICKKGMADLVIYI